MPAKWKYGFMCDGAMQVHGKWTYQGVFTTINGLAFPMLIPEAAICCRFNGPVGAHALSIRLVDSGDKQILPELRQPIECKEFADNDVVVGIRPLPVPAPGFYSFKFYLDQDAEPFGLIEFQALSHPMPPKVPPPAKP